MPEIMGQQCPERKEAILNRKKLSKLGIPDGGAMKMAIRLVAQAGQKGMKSIIQHLGSQDFPRLRLGIGRPPGRMDTADYVLQKFSTKDCEGLGIFLRHAGDSAYRFITNGIDDAMTTFNRTL